MPRGTKVDKIFKGLKRRGKSPAVDARIAQARAGKSLKTGRKPKRGRR